MIDINSLRRLAQAATKGPWVSQGRYIGTPRHMSYIGEVRDQCGNWSDTEKSRSDAAYIAAANPTTINELLNRIEAAESDAVEQARLNGMGASREAALMAKLEAAEKDRDALRAKIEAMEKQEPVAWVDAKEEGYEFYGISYLPVGKHHLYAAPVSAKREWVELTYDEIDLIEQQVYCRTTQKGRPLGVYAVELVRAVIAAFKEKNK